MLICTDKSEHHINHVRPAAKFRCIKVTVEAHKVGDDTPDSLYAVRDEHDRFVGWVAKKKGEWYAMREGRTSVWKLTTREQALDTLRVLWWAEMLSTKSIKWEGV